MNAAEVRQVRAWTGSQPDDVTIQKALDETGSIHAAALQILQTRRADMVRQPGKLAVSGDTSVDWTANLAAIDRQITDLQALVGEGPGQVTVGTLTRTSDRAPVPCRSLRR